MDFSAFDERPIAVAVAGPNGAGKTTFYHAHLRRTGLRYINPDVLGHELGLDAYAAAALADTLRRALLRRRESFIFETVFSDPVGEELAFMEDAVRSGYAAVLCYIGVAGPDTCEARVAMRVSQGGHDVPTEKLRSRYPRTLANLRAAILRLPYVLVFDNDDLSRPFRLAAAFRNGGLAQSSAPTPTWLEPVLP